MACAMTQMAGPMLSSLCPTPHPGKQREGWGGQCGGAARWWAAPSLSGTPALCPTSRSYFPDLQHLLVWVSVEQLVNERPHQAAHGGSLRAGIGAGEGRRRHGVAGHAGLAVREPHPRRHRGRSARRREGCPLGAGGAQQSKTRTRSQVAICLGGKVPGARELPVGPGPLLTPCPCCPCKQRCLRQAWNSPARSLTVTS